MTNDDVDFEAAAEVIRTHSISELADILMDGGFEGTRREAEMKAFEMKSVEKGATIGQGLRAMPLWRRLIVVLLMPLMIVLGILRELARLAAKPFRG